MNFKFTNPHSSRKNEFKTQTTIPTGPWFNVDSDESVDRVTVVMGTKLHLVSIDIEWFPVIAPLKVTKVRLKRSQRKNWNSRKITGIGLVVLAWILPFFVFLNQVQTIFQLQTTEKCIFSRIGKVSQAEWRAKTSYGGERTSKRTDDWRNALLCKTLLSNQLEIVRVIFTQKYRKLGSWDHLAKFKGKFQKLKSVPS